MVETSQIFLIFGITLPVISSIFNTKDLLVPSVFFFFLLFGSIGQEGVRFGTAGHRCHTVSYGKPSTIIEANYCYIYVFAGQESKPDYWDRSYSFDVYWWKILYLLSLSITCAFLLFLPKYIYNKKMLTIGSRGTGRHVRRFG